MKLIFSILLWWACVRDLIDLRRERDHAIE